jgi:hypothetical protein
MRLTDSVQRQHHIYCQNPISLVLLLVACYEADSVQHQHHICCQNPIILVLLLVAQLQYHIRGRDHKPGGCHPV